MEENNIYGFKNIPPDFDIRNYKLLNDDLKYMDNNELMLHYENTGVLENRKYKLEQISTDFNVFVYCSDKSGSSTLHKTMNYNGFKSLHLHNVEDYTSYCCESIIQPDIFKLIETQASKYSNIYVIDVYRTPIERKISSLFEVYGKKFLNMSNNEIYNFCDDNIYYASNYQSITEICEHYNIQKPTSFSNKQKYIILTHKNIKIILLKFDDIKNWDKILSKIFNKNITIISDNISKDKVYYDKLKHIQENYNIPLFMVDVVKNDYYFDKLNSKTFKLNYLNSWKKRTKPNNFKRIPNDFNVHLYKQLNEDLKHLNDIELILHYENEGYKEDREYK